MTPSSIATCSTTSTTPMSSTTLASSRAMAANVGTSIEADISVFAPPWPRIQPTIGAVIVAAMASSISAGTSVFSLDRAAADGAERPARRHAEDGHAEEHGNDHLDVVADEVARRGTDPPRALGRVASVTVGGGVVSVEAGHQNESCCSEGGRGSHYTLGGYRRKTCVDPVWAGSQMAHALTSDTTV